MTRKKKILLSILIILSVGLIAKLSLYFYLNSESARQLLVTKLNKDKRQVSIEDHSFSFFTGITASGIKIKESKDDENREIDIPKASINYNHFFYFRGLPAFQTLSVNDALIKINKTEVKNTTAPVEKTPKTPSQPSAPKSPKVLSEIPELLTDIQFKNMTIQVFDKDKETLIEGLDLSFNTQSDLLLQIKELSVNKLALAQVEIKSKDSAPKFQTFLALLAQEKLKDDYNIEKRKVLDSPINFTVSSQATANKSPLSQALQINANSSLTAKASFDTNSQNLGISELLLNSGNVSLKAFGDIQIKEENIALTLEQLSSQANALKIEISGSFDKPRYKSNNNFLNKLIFDKL